MPPPMCSAEAGSAATCWRWSSAIRATSRRQGVSLQWRTRRASSATRSTQATFGLSGNGRASGTSGSWERTIADMEERDEALELAREVVRRLEANEPLAPVVLTARRLADLEGDNIRSWWLAMELAGLDAPRPTDE